MKRLKKLFRWLSEPIQFCEIACAYGAAFSIKPRWKVWILEGLERAFPIVVTIGILVMLAGYIFFME